MLKQRGKTEIFFRLFISLWVMVGAMMANSPAAAQQDVAEITVLTATRDYAALEHTVRELFASHSVPLPDAGLQFVSLISGETLLDISSEKQLIPASTAKLPTTAAALHLLGADFKYKTRLAAFGTLEDGTLDGDIVVFGSGDPEISGRYYGGDPAAVFKNWAATLVESGITRVTGDIIGDTSTFDGEFVHRNWPREQLDRWYCAPVAALSLNDNCLDVTVRPGAAVGEPVSFSTSPDSFYAPISSGCTTVGLMKDHLYGFVGRAGSQDIRLRGKFWISSSPQTTSIPVDDPPLFFLTVLQETLKSQGISIEGGVRVSNEQVVYDEPAVVEAVHESPLDRILAVANKRSQNFYAEQLLKTLGAQKGEAGSFKQGGGVVRSFLEEITPAAFECIIDDGSGMSRANRLSAKALVDMLAWMVEQPDAKTFLASLPVGGVDGTLSDRFTGDLSGRVFAKTGTLTGVSTLAGYIQLEDDYAAFAILMNSRSVPVWRMRRLMDDICQAVYEFSRKE